MAPGRERRSVATAVGRRGELAPRDRPGGRGPPGAFRRLVRQAGVTGSSPVRPNYRDVRRPRPAGPTSRIPRLAGGGDVPRDGRSGNPTRLIPSDVHSRTRRAKQRKPRRVWSEMKIRAYARPVIDPSGARCKEGRDELLGSTRCCTDGERVERATPRMKHPNGREVPDLSVDTSNDGAAAAVARPGRSAGLGRKTAAVKDLPDIARARGMLQAVCPRDGRFRPDVPAGTNLRLVLDRVPVRIDVRHRRRRRDKRDGARRQRRSRALSALFPPRAVEPDPHRVSHHDKNVSTGWKRIGSTSRGATPGPPVRPPRRLAGLAGAAVAWFRIGSMPQKNRLAMRVPASAWLGGLSPTGAG